MALPFQATQPPDSSDPSMWPASASLNGQIIPNPNMIHLGQFPTGYNHPGGLSNTLPLGHSPNPISFLPGHGTPSITLGAQPAFNNPMVPIQPTVPPQPGFHPSNNDRETSIISGIEIYPSQHGSNNDEKDMLDSESEVISNGSKIIIPIEIKYTLWMQAGRRDGSTDGLKFLKVIPTNPVEPYNVDMTDDVPADMNLDFFKRDMFCHLDGREKLWYLLDRLHKSDQLIWVVNITNSRKYSKRAHLTLKSDSDLFDFLQNAKRLRPNQATVEITMADPKGNQRDQKSSSEVDDALMEEFGTDEERAAIRRKKARKEINPRAETGGALQDMVATLYRVCLDHSERATKGLSFVNPDNTGQYMKMGHHRLTAWAKAIIGGEAGVDRTHPPKTADFEWLRVPGGTTEASQAEPTSNPNISTSTPILNESSNTNRSPVISMSSTNNTVQASSNGGPHEEGLQYGPVAAAYAHFNNDSSPMALTGLESRGSMQHFLRNAMIPIDDRHTRILIDYYRIHHWTYFRRSTMHELLCMGFAPGPARLLIDGVTLYESVLRTMASEEDS